MTPQALRDLPREQEVLIGIDSDGCVFDSMAAKQIRCFHRGFLEVWDLWAWEAPVRETLEFVNLRSATRGRDRFINFAHALDLMARRPELADAPIPDSADLRSWLAGPGPFGNDALERVADRSEELTRLLAWSRIIDTYVRQLGPIPPFEGARAFLAMASDIADCVVISSTPQSVLEAEWSHHGLDHFVRGIAGKECGEKVQQLGAATAGKGYERCLMIGDAPKDLEAAIEAEVSFFPIMADAEEASWQRLNRELTAWIAGDISWEAELEAFRNALPTAVPWPENPPERGCPNG